MQEDFKRILVLTDFSSASLHAAEEAAAIATRFNSKLHLLHVSSSAAVSHLSLPETCFFHVAEEDEDSSLNNKLRLEKMKIDLENRFGICIQSHEAKGPLKKIVTYYVHDLHIDLVVVDAKKKSGIRELLFSSVAEIIINTVESEVLCVYPESNCNRLKKIVLPVGKFVPERKIRMAYELARKFAANVHMISLNKNSNGISNENTKVLMAAYRYLKDITNIPVECRTVSGNNMAEAAIRYAENINADLILVNPGTESQLSGNFLYRWGGDIVNHSPVPVLSVHSNMEKKQ